MEERLEAAKTASRSFFLLWIYATSFRMKNTTWTTNTKKNVAWSEDRNFTDKVKSSIYALLQQNASLCITVVAFFPSSGWKNLTIPTMKKPEWPGLLFLFTSTKYRGRIMHPWGHYNRKWWLQAVQSKSHRHCSVICWKQYKGPIKTGKGFWVCWHERKIEVKSVNIGVYEHFNNRQ